MLLLFLQLYLNCDISSIIVEQWICKCGPYIFYCLTNIDYAYGGDTLKKNPIQDETYLCGIDMYLVNNQQKMSTSSKSHEFDFTHAFNFSSEWASLGLLSPTTTHIVLSFVLYYQLNKFLLFFKFWANVRYIAWFIFHKKKLYSLQLNSHAW